MGTFDHLQFRSICNRFKRKNNTFSQWLAIYFSNASNICLPPALQRFSIHILCNQSIVYCTHSRAKSLLGYWVPHTLQTIWPLALWIVWASLLDSCRCFFLSAFLYSHRSELRGFRPFNSNWNECFICGHKQRSHECGLFSSPRRRRVNREVQKWLHFPRDGYVVITISRSPHRKGFAMWCILSMAMNILSVVKKYIQLCSGSVFTYNQCVVAVVDNHC
jgi:hypothetical protein